MEKEKLTRKNVVETLKEAGFDGKTLEDGNVLQILDSSDTKVMDIRDSRSLSIKIRGTSDAFKPKSLDTLNLLLSSWVTHYNENGPNSRFSFMETQPVLESSSPTITVVDSAIKLIPDDFIYVERPVITGNTDLQEFSDAMDSGKNVLLEGPTGSGKTSLGRKYCAVRKLPYKRISLNGGTTVEDLVGHYILKDGESPWIDGILTRAVREGWVIAVDEINAASPEVLFVLNPLLDDERVLILSSKDGEVLKPHPNFRIFATMNPADEGYAGTHEMNFALKDRFHVALYINYNDKVEKKILRQMGCESELTQNIIDFTKAIREANLKGEIIMPWSTRSVINFADLAEQGKEKLMVHKFNQADQNVVLDLMDIYIYKTKNVGESSSPTQL